MGRREFLLAGTAALAVLVFFTWRMSCGPTLESEARVLGECLRERDVRCVLKFVPNAEIQAFKKANVDVVGLAQLATESISIEPPLVIETSNVGGVMPGGASFTIVGSGQALRLLPISLNLFYSEDGIVSPGLLETLLLHRWLASSAPQQSWMRGGGKLARTLAGLLMDEARLSSLGFKTIAYGNRRMTLPEFKDYLAVGIKRKQDVAQESARERAAGG